MNLSSLSPRQPRLVAMAALLSLIMFSAPAFAEGGSVRYSYEKVDLMGGQQWVLVPHAEVDLATKGKTVSKGTVIEAFDLLKSKKKNVYGNASIKISSGSWPKKAVVQVTIDRSKAKLSAVVIAEVVYTMTELGLPGVEFPGYADGMVARGDIPFSVYTLTVPMWQVLPDADIMPAQVVLSNGETLWVGEFLARWKKKDKALIEDLYAFLDSPNSTTSILVMRKLPTLGVPYADKIIPLLASKNALIRQEALRSLEGEREQEAVLKAVAARLEKEEDAAIQAQAAAFLGGSKNKSYAILEPIWLIEKAPKEEDAVAAIAKITAFKGDARVGETLYKQLSGKRDKVAVAAIAALDKLGDDSARLKAIKDEKIPTSRQLAIAADLSKEKSDASRVAGLSFIGSNAPERDAKRAIAALASAKDDTSRAAAEEFVADKIDWRREVAAKGLAARNETASILAIANALKKYDDDENLEEAGYSIMLSQPLKTILEQTEVKNNVVQRFAYRALGERALKEKAGKKVFETLRAGSTNKDPLIRGASARALGAFASKEAADILSGMVKDKRPEVRRDVAIAIGELKDGVLVDALVGYLDDKSPAVVGAAIDSLGKRGEAGSWDRIKAYTESKEPVIRAAALRGLARLTSREDKQTVTEVISILSGAVNDKNLLVRERAIEQLGTFKDENAVLAIAAQLQAKEIPIRVAAIRALGTTKHPSATPLVTDALEDPNVDVRRAATLAVADLGDKSAKSDLQAQLEKEKDDELKGIMRDTLKRL